MHYPVRRDRLRPGRESPASSRESVRYEKWGKKADVVLRGRGASPPRRIRSAKAPTDLYIERVGHIRRTRMSRAFNASLSRYNRAQSRRTLDVRPPTSPFQSAISFAQKFEIHESIRCIRLIARDRFLIGWRQSEKFIINSLTAYTMHRDNNTVYSVNFETITRSIFSYLI